MEQQLAKFMKRIALIFYLCLVATSSWSAEDGQQFIPIPVQDNTVVTGRTHRAPAYIPIQAYYDGLFASIYVQFLQNIGDVDVTITNLSTGDYVNYDIDTSIGGTLLPISGEMGIYRIVFHLASGTEYEGQFAINGGI